VLLFNPPPGPVAVTVHDIIPYLTRDDPRLCAYRHPIHRLFDWLAMQGLKRAGRLIADSAWTKQTLVDALGYPAGRIDVVHLGVDPAVYRPVAVTTEFRHRYGLPADRRYVTYVGSEDPRKNLETLWRAFAIVHRDHPDTVLLKVGHSHSAHERERLARLAVELGIADAVRFLGAVPEDDLPGIYGASAVCVLPSRYEGFGLPVLEAMACGTPVICASAGSLPEITGRAALSVDPNDIAGLANALDKILAGHLLAGQLRDQGLSRARPFTWSRTAGCTASALAQIVAEPAVKRRRRRVPWMG
jgi:glycosyltransferase involved in cell wall biosynthesis